MVERSNKGDGIHSGKRKREEERRRGAAHDVGGARGQVRDKGTRSFNRAGPPWDKIN